MAREINLISTSDGAHKVCFGMNDDELSSFKVMMWVTHYGPRALDWVQGLSLSFLTFMGGDAWLHNSDDVPRANLYGEQKDVYVDVVANQDPTIMKLFDSIALHTNKDWAVTSVTIPADMNHPDGMWSRIPKERFKKRDGIMWAEFFRNMKSSGGTIKISQAMSGEPLRGRTAYVELKNTSTDQVQLFMVEFYMSKNRQ